MTGPFYGVGSEIVLQVVECLVYEWPAFDFGGQGSETRVIGYEVDCDIDEEKGGKEDWQRVGDEVLFR